MNIAQYYQQLTDKLTRVSNDTAQLDARILICHYLDLDYTHFLLQQQQIITAEQMQHLDAAETLALNHMPISRIIASREFWGLNFIINDDVLDPRADSEILIETLLHFCPPSQQRLNFLDLGTGSGCLLLSLLDNYPKAVGLGVDQSLKALNIAKINAKQLGLLQRSKFIQSDWFDQVPNQKFDIILSNPPYIASDDIQKLAKNVRSYDPINALDGGLDGLDPYHIIIKHAANFLNNDGILILEMGHNQAEALFEILDNHGFSSDQFDMKSLPNHQNNPVQKSGLGFDLGRNPRIIISKFNKTS